ncbi:MAG: PhoU domain-containing protein [Thermoguttaceae bacterium]|nr:PhoU domain-containing protein [Thermoguttaceae bacterium]
MLNWFQANATRSSSGIGKIKADFIEMLQRAREEFLLACQPAIHGVPSDTVCEEVTRLDKMVNKAERQIRKELVIHCSVRGQVSPEALVFMSIAKDAERLGDYAKNIFDMSELAPCAPLGAEKEQLVLLKLLIFRIFDLCILAIQEENEGSARQAICECRWIGKQCDGVTKTLLNLETPGCRTASDVLMFRFMKRIASHLRNICSSVVQPVHKLDFTKKISKSVEISGTILDRKAEFLEEFNAEIRKYEKTI